VEFHSNILRAEGVADQRMEKVRRMDLEDFSPRDRKIIEFAWKSTVDPNNITDKEFMELKEFGLTNQQIVEMQEWMAFNTGITRFVDSLGIIP
jgi:alkylhydroperoxidase family enzyme